MAHQLTPKASHLYLDPEEIVRRLKIEFQYVDADAKRAQESIEEGIVYMLGVKEVFSDEQIEMARQTKGKAIDVILADEPEPGLRYLRVLVEPKMELFFDYESGQHEETAQPLLERVARVLDYAIELV